MSDALNGFRKHKLRAEDTLPSSRRWEEGPTTRSYIRRKLVHQPACSFTSAEAGGMETDETHTSTTAALKIGANKGGQQPPHQKQKRPLQGKPFSHSSTLWRTTTKKSKLAHITRRDNSQSPNTSRPSPHRTHLRSSSRLSAAPCASSCHRRRRHRRHRPHHHQAQTRRWRHSRCGSSRPGGRRRHPRRPQVLSEAKTRASAAASRGQRSAAR